MANGTANSCFSHAPSGSLSIVAFELGLGTNLKGFLMANPYIPNKFSHDAEFLGHI